VTDLDRLFFVDVPAAVPGGASGTGSREKSAFVPETTFVGDDANPVLRQLLCVSGPREVVPLFPRGWPVSYWPLVFFGPAQCGKTSLARAVTAGLEQSAGRGRKVVCLTGPDLVRQVAAAIESQTTSQLRDRLVSSAGVWIDDLDRLEISAAAQEWLLTVVDRMVDDRVPLVATMPGHPARHKGLLPALAGRLTAGLSVPVQLPGLAARCELLGRAALRHRLALSAADLRSLATRFPVSAGKLGRIINLAAAQPALAAGKLDAGRVVELVGQLAGSTPEFSRQLVRLVARHTGLPGTALLGNGRQQTTVLARGMLVYLLREAAGWSFAAIGRLLRGKDHSTVLHANRKIAGRVATDAAFAHTMASLAAQAAELMIDCLPAQLEAGTRPLMMTGKTVDEKLLVVAGEVQT
jgi:chromosomal replication initiator protein